MSLLAVPVFPWGRGTATSTQEIDCDIWNKTLINTQNVRVGHTLRDHLVQLVFHDCQHEGLAWLHTALTHLFTVGWFYGHLDVTSSCPFQRQLRPWSGSRWLLP